MHPNRSPNPEEKVLPHDGLLAHRIKDLANAAEDDARAAGIREVFATDYVRHLRTGGTAVGVDGYIERIAGNLAGIPNMHFEMDDLVVQGDRFALRYHWTAPYDDGTTGTQGLEINRVASSQIVETWNYQDKMSLMIQLGAIQDPFASTS